VTAATPVVEAIETADAQEQAGTPLRDHEQAQRSLALRERAVGDVPDTELRDHLARLVRRSTSQASTIATLSDALRLAQDRGAELQAKLASEGGASAMALAALSGELQARDMEIERLNEVLQARARASQQAQQLQRDLAAASHSREELRRQRVGGSTSSPAAGAGAAVNDTTVSSSTPPQPPAPARSALTPPAQASGPATSPGQTVDLAVVEELRGRLRRMKDEAEARCNKQAALEQQVAEQVEVVEAQRNKVRLPHACSLLVVQRRRLN